MIPAAITHMQAPPEIDIESDVLETQSTHPCHRLSIPAARLFWCRHCMQIFEDPITRWRHSKTCLQSSSGKVRKDKDGSTMQVFLSANNLSELRREHNRSRVISRSAGPGHSPGTDLRCFICKTTFVSIDEMRVHVRTPCRKRPTLTAPKHKFASLPAEVKTQIQIPDTASEIIYIKDGHQTVISLESPCTAELIKTEFVEPSQEYEPDGVSGTEEVIILPDTFDCTTNLNAIEQTVEISAVETVVPFAIKSEEVTKQPKNRNENKENNVRKRKRILPKEVDDRPNHKMSNSPKSEQQIALSLPTKPEDVKDILDDFEVPPIKISKMTNKEPEDETSQTKVRAKPLQIKEEFSQLLTAEKKDNQSFLGGEHLPNGVVTEQVIDEAVLLKAPASPDEKIVTGAAAEAKLKDLFTTMEMRNKTKLPPSPKQTKIVSSPRKSPFKTGSPMKIRNDDIDKCQNDNLVKEERHSCISQEESIDTSGLLLYMPPINAGSVTLPDPLLDLRSGLPAEMLLDETTNTKPPIPVVPEAINTFVPSDIIEETKLPSHIFDGDLLPSQIHSEVLFEEITDEKENPPLVDNRLVEEFVSGETNFKDVIKIGSPVGIDEVIGKVQPVEGTTTFVEVDPLRTKHLEENQEIPLEESESEQVKEESELPIAESLGMSNQSTEPNSAEMNAEMKTQDEADEEEEASIAEKTKTETKLKSAKLFKCKACSNVFKTSQALQKHSRVPCILKHTRSLSQKILRPKQPCLKIEKKPLKKKLAKPSRRPKFMIPIIPITRPELIRPAVPKRPKRFSRRKKRRSFFIDEQNRILPYVNVLMSELSDKDRFFYKLGMINQCRKIPSSETTTTTAPDAEAPAVETLGDSAIDSSSTLQFPGVETESMYPSEIDPLSAAGVVAAEPQGIAYSASPAVAAACVSDKENLSALAKGLCLSLPTLEKMEDTQFHDPNCISPSHVKPDPDDSSGDPSGATGQSVQSPCWEAAPRLAQLPGVTQIVRVTSADLSSADLLNGINATNESSVIPESDQSNVLANSKSLSLSNSSLHCKTQSRKISKEMVNNSDSNIGGHRAAKNPVCEELNSKELGSVFESSASQPKTASTSLQELSGSDTAQKDSMNFSDNSVNKKIQPNSVNKMKIPKTKDGKKANVESKKLLEKDGVVSPDKTNQSRSSVEKNSTKSKLNYPRTAMHDVIESVNPTKNHDRTIDGDRNQTDFCSGANIETGKKEHRSVDYSVSNSQKRSSFSFSKNVSSAVISFEDNRNSNEPASSGKRVTSSEESRITTPTAGKGVASNQESPWATTTSCKKVPSSPESLLATLALGMKIVPSQESRIATTAWIKKEPPCQESPVTAPTSCKKIPSNLVSTSNSCKKVSSNQESPMFNTTLGKKVPLNKESPLATTTLGTKTALSQEFPMSTTILCKKEPSSPESFMATVTSIKKIAPNQESRIATTTLVKEETPSQEYSVTASTSCKKVPSNQESSIATASLGKEVVLSQESPVATTILNKAVPLSQESLIINPAISKKLASHWNSTMPTFPSSSEKVISKQHSMSPREKTEFNAGNTMKENTNLISTKIENSSQLGLANDQNSTSPISTLPAITSRLSSIAVCGHGSGSVADSTKPHLMSLAGQMRPDAQKLRESKTLTQQMPEDQSGEPVINRENDLELQPLQDNVAQPILKSLHVDVEEIPKCSSDVNNERQRHFSDIFGHEKDSLGGEDSSVNYQISPSKERSKRHFTDFLCGFSGEASASLDENTGHSGCFLEKIKSIKIEEPSVSENSKTNETVAISTSLNQEKGSEDSQTSSGIGFNNVLQVAEIPAVSCKKLKDQEFGNGRFVRMMESVLVNEKLKDLNPSRMSGECHSKIPMTKLPSGESLLNPGSVDPHKIKGTAVVPVTNTAVTTDSSFSVNNNIVTNSSPVEYKTPSQNSETPLNVSTTATLNPRVSIATQTDSSFLKETKTGSGVPSGSCDNMEKNEAPSSSVSFHPDPPLPLPSSPTTDSTPTPVDNPPSPIVLSEDERCEVVQENLDPSVLPSPQEIIINDTPLPSVSPSPPGTMCEPVQGDSGLQEENTDASVLLPQPVPEPSSNIAIEPPLQQLVLDNATDPNVLVQYLNSLDTSMLPQEVTFVIIQGTPGEPLQLTDDHNFIIEQTAFSEHAEQESANSSVIYTLQPPQSDITTETECIMTDSS